MTLQPDRLDFILDLLVRDDLVHEIYSRRLASERVIRVGHY